MNFDRTFILHVDRPRTPFADTMTHLAEQDIQPEVFRGIDGSISGLQTTHVYEVDVPGSGYRMGPITIGIYLGHYMLWSMCAHLAGDSFLLLEEDVRFRQGWKEKLAEGWQHLPDSWDIVYLGNCCMTDRSRIHVSGQLYKIEYALCMHAYVVRKKALALMLEKLEKVWAPLDLALVSECFPHLNVYAFYPRLADQRETIFPD